MLNRWLVVAALLGAGFNSSHAKDVVPSVQLHGQRFSVEFAIDDASRQRGLMMRTVMAADHSMLFAFSTEDPQAFWMKDTLIPLDILYFDAERRLVSMQLDVPPCKADPCPIYPSNLPARYVLELAAGTARRVGVVAGDVLTIDGDMGKVR